MHNSIRTSFFRPIPLNKLSGISKLAVFVRCGDGKRPCVSQDISNSTARTNRERGGGSEKKRLRKQTRQSDRSPLLLLAKHPIPTQSIHTLISGSGLAELVEPMVWYYGKMYEGLPHGKTTTIFTQFLRPPQHYKWFE